MNLEGRTTRLRALEPGDIDLMYAWENDTAVWSVSGTLAPFSRHTLERFIQEQQFDIFQTRQQRLVIETLGGIPVGALDFFELDPINRRGRHRNPDPRRRAARQRLCVGCRGDGMRLCC